MIVSAAPSSALRIMTFPSGAWPSSHGHSPPVVTAPTTAIVSWLLPVPGSPAMQVCFPRASRPDQSHSIFSGVISAAQRETKPDAATLPFSGRSPFDRAGRWSDRKHCRSGQSALSARPRE